MVDLKHQSDLTDGKGWKEVLVEHAKKKVEQVKTKAENVWGGVKVVAKKLKGKD